MTDPAERDVHVRQHNSHLSKNNQHFLKEKL